MKYWGNYLGPFSLTEPKLLILFPQHLDSDKVSSSALASQFQLLSQRLGLSSYYSMETEQCFTVNINLDNQTLLCFLFLEDYGLTSSDCLEDLCFMSSCVFSPARLPRALGFAFCLVSMHSATYQWKLSQGEGLWKAGLIWCLPLITILS